MHLQNQNKEEKSKAWNKPTNLNTCMVYYSCLEITMAQINQTLTHVWDNLVIQERHEKICFCFLNLQDHATMEGFNWPRNLSRDSLNKRFEIGVLSRERESMKIQIWELGHIILHKSCKIQDTYYISEWFPQNNPPTAISYRSQVNSRYIDRPCPQKLDFQSPHFPLAGSYTLPSASYPSCFVEWN